MNKTSSIIELRRFAAAAIVVSLAAGAALAAPSQVNISGATLFGGFFQAPASTNDYIDVNHDGIKGFDLWDLRTPQNLALGDWKSPNTWWIVMYRGVGSGNGLAAGIWGGTTRTGRGVAGVAGAGARTGPG